MALCCIICEYNNKQSTHTHYISEMKSKCGANSESLYELLANEIDYEKAFKAPLNLYIFCFIFCV